MKATQDKASADVTQTTFPRYHVECHNKQNFVSSTGHSMYLTTILTNEDMWNSLDLEDQMHFQTAAKICARTERTRAVADADEIKTDTAKQSELGIDKVIDFSDAERSKIEQALEQVSNKWEKYFSKGLVDSIRKVQ